MDKEYKVLTEIPLKELEARIKTICIDAIRETVQKAIVKKDDTLLTRKETAYELKISLPTLHSWTEKGILTAHYLGRKKFYKRSEVLDSSLRKGGLRNV